VAKVAFVSLFALLLTAPGCAAFKKSHECGKLAKKVNGFIGETRRDAPASYADPLRAAKESRELAESYRRLSRDLGALGLRSEELVLRVARYRKLADDAALALDGAAQALEKHDLEQARTRRLDFDRAAKDESPLVREINAVCSR
jgi:hypothetical protein